MVDQGHHVDLLTSDPKASNRNWQRDQANGVQIFSIGVRYDNHFTSSRRLYAFIQFILAVQNRGRCGRYDIVFASSTPLTVAIPGARLARFHGVPFVFEVRDLWPSVPIDMGYLRNPILRWAALRLENYAYKRADEIIALSPGMASHIEKWGFEKNRITVIPNGCDIEDFSGDPAPGGVRFVEHLGLANRPLVLYAGALGKANGVPYLLELAESLAKTDSKIFLLVLGHGAMRPWLEKEAARRGIPATTLKISDPIPKSDVVAVFQRSHLALSLFSPFKSLADNSPNKAFDALAAGRPIAINNGGWLGEVIKNHHCGLVLDPDSPSQAARDISKALGDQKWQDQARAAAVKLAREKFSRNRQFSLFENVLLRAIDRGPIKN
jgi:glycosyltransferase involved in cell wall biosynthesis